VISLFIIAPLASVIILNLPFKKIMHKAIFWFGVALCLAQIHSAIFLYLNIPSIDLGSFFKLDLFADNLSIGLLVCIGLVLFITFLMSRHFIENEEQRFSFMNLLLIVLMGMNGIVLVRDIFTLYVFLEVTAVATFVLVAFQRKPEALEGAFKYLILSSVASVFMLTAIALIFIISGDTSFSVINSVLKNATGNRLIIFAVGIFLSGLFIKAGLVPFHGWLADAHSAASSPISVLLSGIVVEITGIYALIRLVSSVFVFDNSLKSVTMLVGAISIVAGALLALGQQDFKRMLAYSTTSQVGYMLLSFGCGTALGTAAALFHLFNHAAFKSLLFLNAGAVELQTGTRNMDRLGGLAAKMPVTGTTSVVAGLSMAGVPPFSGFWSKLLIVIALWVSGHYTYAVIAILASILTLGYALSIQRRIFFGKVAEGLKDTREVDFGLLLPQVILAAIIVAVGLVSPWVLKWK
jgi:multicomponent Na+:H+ antiporter subunit D